MVNYYRKQNTLVTEKFLPLTILGALTSEVLSTWLSWESGELGR